MRDEDALARPVGWWLKEADSRLDAAFDRALEGTGIDRRRWQVLESVVNGPVSTAQLADSLAAFDAPDALQPVVDDLRTRGWVEASADPLRLTSAGTRRHAEIAHRIQGVRQQVRAALPGDDYVTLVRLLARLTDAL